MRTDDTLVRSLRTIATIDLDIGGEIRVLRPQRHTKMPEGVTILHETDSYTGGYLTVHHENGHGDLYEFCFRVNPEARVARLTTLTRIYRGRDPNKGPCADDCMTGWVPNEVRDEITVYHPGLEVKAGEE